MPLRYRLRTGIDVRGLPGFIPELYVREACNKANYQFETSWTGLEREEQAAHIAAYILENLIENHAQDAQQVEMNRKK